MTKYIKKMKYILSWIKQYLKLEWMINDEWLVNSCFDFTEKMAAVPFIYGLYYPCYIINVFILISLILLVTDKPSLFDTVYLCTNVLFSLRYGSRSHFAIIAITPLLPNLPSAVCSYGLFSPATFQSGPVWRAVRTVSFPWRRYNTAPVECVPSPSLRILTKRSAYLWPTT
jgi:hypothetical protein